MLAAVFAVLGLSLAWPGALARNIPDSPLLGYPPLPGQNREERLSVAEWPGYFPVSPFLPGVSPLPVFSTFSQPQPDTHATDVLLDLIASLRESLAELQQRQNLIVEAIQSNCSAGDPTQTNRFPGNSGGILGHGLPGFSGGPFGGNALPGFSGGIFGGSRYPLLSGGLLGGGGLHGGLAGFAPQSGFSGIPGFSVSLGGSVSPGLGAAGNKPGKPASTAASSTPLTTVPSSPMNSFSTFSGSSTSTGPEGTITTTVVGKPGEEPIVTTVTSKPPPNVRTEEEEMVDAADE